MSNENAQNTPDHRPAVGVPVERMVRPLLKLTARTKKGKNRLREACEALPAWDGFWEVHHERKRVTFAPGIDGPWLFIEPAGAEQRGKDRHSRWVHAEADADFHVSAA